MSLILSLLVNYSSLFRINLQLNLIDLSFCVLTVHLVVHFEEGQERHDISKDKVYALAELKESWVVFAQFLELHEVDTND